MPSTLLLSIAAPASRNAAPVRAAVARVLFTRAVAALPLRVRFPDGRLLGAGPPDAPVMVLHRPREFFRRFGASGLIGFGESYLAGDWDCADLTGLLTVFAARAGDLMLQDRHHLGLQYVAAGDDQVGRRGAGSGLFDQAPDLGQRPVA